jgi:hypothetical protein
LSVRFCRRVVAASSLLRTGFGCSWRLRAAQDARNADVFVNFRPVGPERGQFNDCTAIRARSQETRIPPKRRLKDPAIGQRHAQMAIVAPSGYRARVFNLDLQNSHFRPQELGAVLPSLSDNFANLACGETEVDGDGAVVQPNLGFAVSFGDVNVSRLSAVRRIEEEAVSVPS